MHVCRSRTHLLLGAEEKVVGGAKLNGMLVRHSSQQHRDLGPRRHVLVGIAPHIHPLHRAPQYAVGLYRLLTVRQSCEARDESEAAFGVVGCECWVDGGEWCGGWRRSLAHEYLG